MKLRLWLELHSRIPVIKRTYLSKLKSITPIMPMSTAISTAYTQTRSEGRPERIPRWPIEFALSMIALAISVAFVVGCISIFIKTTPLRPGTGLLLILNIVLMLGILDLARLSLARFSTYSMVEINEREFKVTVSRFGAREGFIERVRLKDLSWVEYVSRSGTGFLILHRKNGLIVRSAVSPELEELRPIFECLRQKGIRIVFAEHQKFAECNLKYASQSKCRPRRYARSFSE